MISINPNNFDNDTHHDFDNETHNDFDNETHIPPPDLDDQPIQRVYTPDSDRISFTTDLPDFPDMPRKAARRISRLSGLQVPSDFMETEWWPDTARPDSYLATSQPDISHPERFVSDFNSVNLRSLDAGHEEDTSRCSSCHNKKKIRDSSSGELPTKKRLAILMVCTCLAIFLQALVSFRQPNSLSTAVEQDFCIFKSRSLEIYMLTY